MPIHFVTCENEKEPLVGSTLTITEKLKPTEESDDTQNSVDENQTTEANDDRMRLLNLCNYFN